MICVRAAAHVEHCAAARARIFSRNHHQPGAASPARTFFPDLLGSHLNTPPRPSSLSKTPRSASRPAHPHNATRATLQHMHRESGRPSRQPRGSHSTRMFSNPRPRTTAERTSTSDPVHILCDEACRSVPRDETDHRASARLNRVEMLRGSTYRRVFAIFRIAVARCLVTRKRG